MFVLQWYTLNDIKSGQVHLLLEWLPTASNADKLDQVILFINANSNVVVGSFPFQKKQCY